jgi:Flp pilus assembly protein TadG
VAALSIVDHLHRLRRDERGAVNILMGLLLIPLIGGLALGFEVSNWYKVTRDMQNAADSAAVAAATAAAANGGLYYDVEAKAVAARYGFVDGVNNVTVVPSNNATCPSPPAPSNSNTCYSVKITGLVPLLLSQVVGYQGSTTVNGARQQQLSATAIANAAAPLCMLALATSGAPQGIRTNGSPTGDMNGCNVMSNTAAQCNGSNLNAGFGFAHTTSNNCGVTPVSNVATVQDPYAYLAKNIPPLSASPCPANYAPNKYPQEGKKGSGATSVSGNYSVSSSVPLYWCGDQILTGPVTISGNPGAVLIIENGQLDLNGNSLTSSGVPIVFSGDNSSGQNGPYNHMPSDNSTGGKGNLNIAAPTTGPWSGVALYQDPSLTDAGNVLDVYAAGNSPTWNITGLIYMPHASVTLKGAIDKANNASQCVVMVADNFTISGTGGILKTDVGQCAQAGLNQVSATTPGLVQ